MKVIHGLMVRPEVLDAKTLAAASGLFLVPRPSAAPVSAASVLPVPPAQESGQKAWRRLLTGRVGISMVGTAVLVLMAGA
jgi:hypothetical protein